MGVIPETDADGTYAASIAAFNRNDDAEGSRLAGLAAAMGDRRSQWSNAASAAYRRGDLAEARKWWEKSAQLHCVRAFFNLGWLAEVAEDSTMAIHFYELSANGGSAAGALNLGSYLSRHELADRETIRKWYRIAADLGQPIAISNLAFMAEDDGHKEEALSLHVQAARAGSRDSAEHLVQIADNNDQFGEYLRLAVAAGAQEYEATLRDWTEQQTAAALAEELDCFANVEHAQRSLATGELEAAYEHFAAAILDGELPSRECQNAVEVLVRSVLIPSHRLIEAAVWIRLLPGHASRHDIADEIDLAIRGRSAFQTLIRLPENESWRTAEATLASFADDTYQDRYDRYIAFAVQQQPGAGLDMQDFTFVDYIRGFIIGLARDRFKLRHHEFRLEDDMEVLLASVVDYLESALQLEASEPLNGGSRKDVNTFKDKCEILGDLWINYRDDEAFSEFIEYNDVGLPLAYCISAGLAEPKTEGEKYVNETWNLLVEALGLDISAVWKSLDVMLAEASASVDDDVSVPPSPASPSRKRMNIFGK